MLRDFFASLAKTHSRLLLEDSKNFLWLSRWFADAETWLATPETWADIRKRRR